MGRRPLLVGGALLCAVAMCVTAWVGTLPAVVALRLVLGVAEAAFFVASIAALADLAPPNRIGEALSYNSLGLYLGLALGPPLGEVVVGTAGFDGAWYVAAGLALLAAAVAGGVGETRVAGTEADGPARLVHRQAIAPGLGFLASVVAMGGLLAFASLHADAVGLSTTSLPLLVYGGVVVVCRVVFAQGPGPLPPLRLGAAALVTIAAGLTVAAMWSTPLGIVAGTAVTALGVAFSTPAFFAAIFATAGPSERGAASGTASAFIDLGTWRWPDRAGARRRGRRHPVGLRRRRRGRSRRRASGPCRWRVSGHEDRAFQLRPPGPSPGGYRCRPTTPTRGSLTEAPCVGMTGRTAVLPRVVAPRT